MPEYCEVTRSVWPCKLIFIGFGQFPALEKLTSVINTGLYSWSELVVGGNAMERVTSWLFFSELVSCLVEAVN